MTDIKGGTGMTNVVTVKKEKTYEAYEKLSRSQYDRRCIDNTIAGCSRCVGYCKYEGHPGFLTEKHRKVHRCIEKGCYYYLAKPAREKTTLKRPTDLSSSILSLAREILAGEEYTRVIRVENKEADRYTAFYVTITNECGFADCTSLIRRELGTEVDFVKLNYDFDKCVALLCAV